MYSYSDIVNSAEYISSRIKDSAKTALVLGSGLGYFIDKMQDKIEIPYSEIPNFPISTAPGHHGKLVFGKINNINILVMSGRFHYYEGYSMAEIAFPVRVLKLLGIKNYIVTNAAGAINQEMLSVGDLMLITDHIKLCADSPLRGRNFDELGPRFNDMTHAYSKALKSLCFEAALEEGISLKSGVYGYMTGPSYETPAEIRALRTLGADVVGMSTVPEVIAARHCSLNILGISCATNFAAGILDKELSEQEVLDAAKLIQDNLSKLLCKVISKIDKEL